MVGVASFLHLTHICIKHNSYNKHQRGFGRGEEVTERQTAWVGQREGLSGWRVGTHTGQREAFLSALLSRMLIEEDMGLCPILALSCSSEAPPETAWDLGPFAAVLKCLHLDNKIQGNSKGLKITVCMHSWDKKWTKRYKKSPNWKSVEEQVPGASTWDPTHDKVLRRRPDKQGRSGLQGFRKAAPALTLKMISVFLMLYQTTP